MVYSTSGDLDQHAPFLADIRLSPHASLSYRGQIILLAGLGGVSFIVSAFFVLRGYWPMAPFLGLDFAMLAFAFHLSRRRERSCEQIVVSPGEIIVRRLDGTLVVSEERIPTLFARLGQEVHPDFGCLSLTLSRGGMSIALGADVSPVERSDLASRLEALLQLCRRGGLAVYPLSAAHLEVNS